MRIFQNLSELQAAVGEELGTSDWVQVDQAQIDRFAEATGDHQWIHVDPARAKDGPFGTTVAHGFLTLSLIPVFMAQTYEVHGLAGALNYGLEKVRFPSPVPVGSRLRSHTTLTSFDEIPGGGQTVTAISVEREGSAKPVCVAQMIARYFV